MTDLESALDSGDFPTAERLARAALSGIGDPRTTEALRLRARIAICQAKTGRPAEARAALLSEAEATGGHQELWIIAGALRRCGFYREALEQFERLFREGVRHPDLLVHLGLMNAFGRWAEAEAIFRQALALSPGHREAAARVDRLLCNRDERAAEGILATHAQADQALPRLRFPLAMAILAQGRWREGWPYYESRRELKDNLPDAPYPAWDRRLDPSKVLILRAEEGAGDAIMFARFAIMLAALGQTVILMVPAKLRALLSTLPGVAEVISFTQKVGNADIVWAPLESLAGFFAIEPISVPAMTSYLGADPRRQERWREWLPKAGLRIGIAWQGAPGGLVDEGRSIPLAAFAPLAKIPDVSLVALQHGAGTEQIGACGFAEKILQPGEDFDPPDAAFTDTAAMMMSLDLVVTSDTAIAHLAGALGGPVFLALKKFPEWRWCGTGETTPWYPSMRLFRQREEGDWDDVFRRIAKAIRERA